MINVLSIIEAKRDGGELNRAQIEWVIQKVADGGIPDYQLSALAMAIYCRGMSYEETVYLTRAMRDSGQVLSWQSLRPVGDKHSTGGVGDKISIPLAPALAAAGLWIPMISGRGLGPTGGTLDKLESIPGYRCDLNLSEFQQVVADVGCSITGATDQIAPADRRLYALRDVTGTVPSIPLITASILSKKLAAGLDALVLDVKWGSGAFMKTREQAQALASRLVQVSNELGVNTTALITNMNQPLGQMVGNANEVHESIEILNGRGPTDVRRLLIELGSQLMKDCGVADELSSAAEQLAKTLDDGSALAKFEQMVRAHGGDLQQLNPLAPRHAVCATESGFLSAIHCQQLGLAVIELGGGRSQLGETIDPAVGLQVMVRLGDWVNAGQELAGVYTRQRMDESFQRRLAHAFEFSDTPRALDPLIAEKLD